MRSGVPSAGQPYNCASFQPAPWCWLGARGVLTSHLQGKESKAWGAAPLMEGRERGEIWLPRAAFDDLWAPPRADQVRQRAMCFLCADRRGAGHRSQGTAHLCAFQPSPLRTFKASEGNWRRDKHPHSCTSEPLAHVVALGVNGAVNAFSCTSRSNANLAIWRLCTAERRLLFPFLTFPDAVLP